jgi:hypothetical protein
MLICHSNLQCLLQFRISQCFGSQIIPPPFMAQEPLVDQSLLIDSRSHSAISQSRGLSGPVINPTQRPLPDITQNLRETDTHVPVGIRTRNPRNLAATNLSLRLRDHRVRHPQTHSLPRFQREIFQNSLIKRISAASIVTGFSVCQLLTLTSGQKLWSGH